MTNIFLLGIDYHYGYKAPDGFIHLNGLGNDSDFLPSDCNISCVTAFGDFDLSHPRLPSSPPPIGFINGFNFFPEFILNKSHYVGDIKIVNQPKINYDYDVRIFNGLNGSPLDVVYHSDFEFFPIRNPQSFLYNPVMNNSPILPKYQVFNHA